MELNIWDRYLKIASIKKRGISKFMHVLLKIGILNESRQRFFSLTETCEEYTLIMEADKFKDLPADDDLVVGVGTWVPMCVSAGAYSTNQVSGIATITKSMILPLADNGISIYSLSSYQTDYILVKTEDLSRAAHCLSSQNTAQKHSLGQSFPLDRIQLQEETSLPPATPRPITHSFHTPRNEFHISSIDRDTMLTVGLQLVEALFYPKCVTDCASEEVEHFISFTVVDQDITLVLDAETFAKFPTNSIFRDQECWRMIKIGDQSDDLGFSECGIVAQISDPIASANISEYYISTFCADHTLVPESSLEKVVNLLNIRLEQTRKSTAPSPGPQGSAEVSEDTPVEEELS